MPMANGKVSVGIFGVILIGRGNFFHDQTFSIARCPLLGGKAGREKATGKKESEENADIGIHNYWISLQQK